VANRGKAAAPGFHEVDPARIVQHACAMTNEKRAAFAVCLAGIAACSMVVVDGPPRARPSRDEPIRCTSGSWAPTVDSVGGILLGSLVALGGMVAHELNGACMDPWCAPHVEAPWTGGEIATVAALSVAVAVPFVASAVVGDRRIDRCRQALARQARDRRARSPDAGKRGEGCRFDGTCEAGLECLADQCVPVAPLPREGEPCAGAMPGVANTGKCERGLLCRGTTCVRPAP